MPSSTDLTVFPPIAARERGPGPGRYGLPSTVGSKQHDPTKHKKPAYSFGYDLGSSIVGVSDSPGPMYLIDSPMTRYGRDGSPIYSMLARPRDPTPFDTPSPAAYAPQRVHPLGEPRAPIYSMRPRTMYRTQDTNPASNHYKLPTLIGPSQISTRAGPSYSLTARSNIGGYLDNMSKTPGPGQYPTVHPDVVLTRRPRYSLLGRSYMPGDSTMKPGPGAHSPERVYINKAQAARYSLGIRHSDYLTPFITE